MFKDNQTKHMFAEALIRLMKETPLDRITISDIITECGASRRTFYYHFKDKQDLVCWYFDQDISHLGTGEYVMTKDGERRTYVNAIAHHFYENKDFYANALRSTAQNSLRDHVFEFVYRYRYQQIQNLLGERTMDPEGIKYLAAFFTHASVGLMIKRAEDGMVYPPEHHDRGFGDVTTVCLAAAVDRYAEPLWTLILNLK